MGADMFNHIFLRTIIIHQRFDFLLVIATEGLSAGLPTPDNLLILSIKSTKMQNNVSSKNTKLCFY